MKEHQTPSPSLLAFFLSLTGLLGMIWVLYLIDYQVASFVKSDGFVWFHQFGRVGQRMGEGLSLVVFSGGLLVAGYAWKHENLRHAGLHGLMAHAGSAVITHLFKHLIGRPRPGLALDGVVHFGPTFQGGYEAFPSGHASAAFSVAAVMARYYPKGAWAWYGVAVFVAASRVAKGSHFPTDIVAGSALGFVVGYVVSRPISSWRTSLMVGLPRFFSALVVVFGLFWICVHRHLEGSFHLGMIWTGIVAVLAGMGLRLFLASGGGSAVSIQSQLWSGANVLVALGLSLQAESLMVMVFTLAATTAWWLNNRGAWQPIGQDDTRTRNVLGGRKPRLLFQEARLAGGLVAMMFLIHESKSLVPLV